MNILSTRGFIRHDQDRVQMSDQRRLAFALFQSETRPALEHARKLILAYRNGASIPQITQQIAQARAELGVQRVSNSNH